MRRVYGGTEYLTRQEAARELHCSVKVIDHLRTVNLLTTYLLQGRYVRLRASEVDALRRFDPVTLSRA